MAGTSSATSSTTWQNWSQVYASEISTTNGTWQNWNQGWYSVGTTTVYTQPLRPVPETDEVRERRRAEQAQAAQAAIRYRAEQEEIRQRAEELLTALLSDEQAQTWRAHHWFTVRGSRTGRTYRIRRGIAGNVDLMAEFADAAEITYCAHPPDVPAADVCLAQLFLLATDEDQFLAVANVHRRHAVPERHLQAVA